MKVVIMHPEMGIYLGNCLGLGFWTRLDPVGQPSAVTFANEAEARAHVATWDDNNDPDAYAYTAVAAAGDHYVTIRELKESGLGHLLGEMEADALRYGPVAGAA